MLSGFDERGQAIQIGAVLLFGLLVIAFASYQAFVVPDQNKQIEFKHSQAVQQDLQEVRNAIVSVSGSRTDSVAVALGTQYPSRALFLNPGPPTGSLRTAGTTNGSINLTIRNATGSGEVGDFWNGSTRRYATGGLVYRSNYNEFRGSPSIVYGHSVLYNQYRNQNVTLTGQRLVDGRDITVTTLNGSLGETRSGSYSVDVDPLSVSEQRIEVRNDSHNVTVSFPTRLGAGRWRELLDGEFTDQGGHVAGIRSERLSGEVRLLRVDLESGVNYNLRMRKVGIGTGTVKTDSEYLVPIEGNGTTIPEGASVRLVVEVRDGYNNPMSGRTVNASASLPGGSVSPTQAETSSEGRLVLEYNAPADISGVAQKRDRINVSFTVGSPDLNDSSFDRSEPASATIPVRVTNADSSGLGGSGGGGNAAYSVEWRDPGETGNPNADLSDCSETSCTWNVDESDEGTLTLTGLTEPAVDGVTLDYAVGDASIGTVSPGGAMTDGSGTATTELTPADPGEVDIYVASGGSSDVITVDITNVFDSIITDFEGSADLADFPFSQDGSGDVRIIQDAGAASSGSNAVLIENTESNNALVSRVVNTGSVSELYVQYAVKEGYDGSTPEGSDAGEEDLVVELLNNQDQWIEVDRFEASDTVDNVFDSRDYTTSDGQFLHDGLQIRFRQSAASGTDPWVVDDVCVVRTESQCTFGGGGGGSTASVGIIYRSNSNGNLFSVDASGETIDFGANKPQNVGSPIDFDGDSALEVPYIDQGGRLDIVDKNGDSSTVTSAPQTLRFGSGTYRDSDVIVYVNGDGNIETVDESGSTSELEQPSGGGSPIQASAVAGTGDTVEGTAEEIYYTSGSEVRYVKRAGPNDQSEATGFSRLADSQAISNPANFGVGTGAAVAVKNNNGNIEIVNTGTMSEISLAPEPKAAPMGAYDYTGDSTPEVIFIDQSDTLRYVTVGGSVGQVTDAAGNPITVQNTPGVTG